MSKKLPKPPNPFKGESKQFAGGNLGLLFGVPPPALMKLNEQQRSGGITPSFLSPFGGREQVEGELTGDQSADRRNFISKYGLFAAPWLPAVQRESRKKAALEAQVQHQNAYEQSLQPGPVTPVNRFIPPIPNQQGGGVYNDIANQLATNNGQNLPTQRTERRFRPYPFIPANFLSNL